MLSGMSPKPAAKTTVHVLPGVMDLFRARFKESKKLKTIWTAAAWMALQATDAATTRTRSAVLSLFIFTIMLARARFVNIFFLSDRHLSLSCCRKTSYRKSF